MERALSGSGGLAPDQLRSILDRLPGAVLAVDLDSRVRYFNLAARRLVHPSLLRVGAPLPEVPAEPSLQDILDRLGARRIVADQEVTLPGDRTYVLGGSFSPQTGLVVLQFVDVSGRARRRRAGEDFVVNAAHEFLSPLTAIAGAAHVLREGADAEPEIRERFLGHISEATGRLIGISRALLVLARAEAGMEPPRLDLVPLQPLLAEVAAACLRDVAVRCPDDAMALTDPDLLRQALTNIVDNASRHSTGKVAVSVAEQPERTVRIEIADSGSGILPEHLDRVTERFFSSAGRDSSGFGIGLSIAARSVSAAGGSLSVRSNRGGTRAVVEVPHRPMSGRILLVEDEQAIADAVQYSLGGEGYDVDVVTDGEAAAEAPHDQYDLVVLDLMLPKLSGIEVCRRIREHSIVPIVMLTARTAEVDRVLGLEAGADDYVAKPFSMPELLSRVRAILRRRRLDSGAAAQTALEVDGLRLDLVQRTLSVAGHPVATTPSEFRLLALLAGKPGTAFTRREIVEHLWNGTYVGERTCDVHVKNLRRKIERDPARPERLVSVRGVGYMLRAS